MSKQIGYVRVAVLWHDTVFTEKSVSAHSGVTVGEQSRNTLMIPQAAGIGDQHKLVSASGDHITVHLTQEMTGRCFIGGKELPLSEARKGSSLELQSEKDWALLNVGAVSLLVQMVERSTKVARAPFWTRMESSFLAAFLAAVMIHFALLISAFWLWDDEPKLEGIDLSDRFLKILVEDPPPENEPEEEDQQEEIDEDVGKKAGGEEGKFGEPDKVEESKVPKRDGEMVDKIKDVGIHKALGSNLIGRGPLKNVFGDQAGFGDKLNAAMSGVGDDLVVGHGAGGMGLRGTGSGGGGEGFGRIHGMGKIDTGGGRGTKASLGGKKAKKKKVSIKRGKEELSGFCKQADILRVVSARQSGIQYCYEKELARNPELNGRVTMSWRIGLDGAVVNAFVESSTLGNKQVEGCIARQIQRWRFAKPEGGMCQVRFPFVFNAGL